MSHQAHLIKARCTGGLSQLAAAHACGVSLSNFNQWALGRRPVPVTKGATVERVLGIPRWLLWPDDWHLIWPELVGMEGAPPPPMVAEGEQLLDRPQQQAAA